MSLLEVNHLRKTFGELVAVADISFHVDAGEIFGLLGPNGAGKSTTMMMLAGLVTPDAGSIQLGEKPFDPTDHTMRSMLGVVPQDLAIYPDLTARENLQFFGQLYGISKKVLVKRIGDTLGRIGLTDRADDLTREYSGGMKRRLNFGCALLHSPKLLILDEPTVGVDPQSRSHLLDCVRELSEEGMACIYASHYMEEVQAICRRVAIIDHGKMLACGELRELLGGMPSGLCLRVDKPPQAVISQLQGLAEIALPVNGEMESKLVVSRAERDGDQQLSATLMKVVQVLERNGVKLHGIETQEPNLETLFLQLTGNRLRD